MFGAVPVKVPGGSGLKLNNLSDEVKILADIRDGDVVIAVDGVAMGDLMANPGKWMSYSGSNSLSVTVVRQGQEETVYVNAASLYSKMLP
jgi:S1-C subfamily serine protease